MDDANALDTNAGMSDPWKGPAPPGFFTGSGFTQENAYLGPLYHLLAGSGSFVAKGESLLAGSWHANDAVLGHLFGRVPYVGDFFRGDMAAADAVAQDARDRVAALSPTPGSVGTAAQLLHGLGEIGTGALLGGPAGRLGSALGLGTVEAHAGYREAREAGIAPTTATALGLISGVSSGAGLYLPGGVGSSLVTRLLTGAGGNIGFGLVNRYADHAVLSAAGYQQMADAQKPWDATSILADAVMGFGFGGLGYYHAHAEELQALAAARDEPGVEDAALTASLAARDRQLAPGVPVSPADAAAHQAALEKATTDLMSGQPVNVAGTGVEGATYAAVDRGEPPPPREFNPIAPGQPFRGPQMPQVPLDPREKLLVDSFRNAGLLDGQIELENLERALGKRLGERAELAEQPRYPVPVAGEPASEVDLGAGAQPAQARAALPEGVIEHPIAGSLESAYEGRLPGGESVGLFFNPEEAGREVKVSTDIFNSIPAADHLEEGDRAIETAAREWIAANPRRALQAYAQLADSEGGKILSTDTARELFPGYLADRTRSQAVHEPASWIIRQLYAEALDQKPTAGAENKILWTAGGTGAGKTSVVKRLLGAERESAHRVYDTNIANFKSGKAKIDQGLAKGFGSDVVYVDRDPTEALVKGALTRAMDQEARYGSGRTVPIADHVNTHVDANQVIRQLAAHYADEPRVRIQILDNRNGKDRARIGSLETLPEIDRNETHTKVLAALEAEHQAGRISDAVYRGFRGVEPGAEGELGAGARGQPQQERPGGRPDELAQGAPEKVYTAAGREVEVRPKIVEAADLKTSDQAGYPQELQPRQRGSRKALEGQVNEMAQNLRPTLLGTSAEADRGAPIVSPGNEVESGNGRVMAIRKVYAAEHPPGEPETKATLKTEFIGRDDAYWGVDMKEVGEPREGLKTEVASEFRGSGFGGTQCTGYACSILEKLGPGRVKVYGFDSEQNPGSSIAQDAGGHDFAVVDGRFIVDPWLPEFGPGKETGVYDLERDQKKVAALYGDRSKWEDMTARMPAAASKAQQYRDFIESQGHDIKGFKEPVLVRERLTPMDMATRRQFTLEANQGSTAELSPVERAQADARNIDSGTMAKLAGADLATVSNAPFVRDFIDSLPQSEHSAMMNPDATLSQAGVRRIQAAILAKAYGGMPESNQTLGRILESTDQSLKSTTNALIDAAPAFARLSQMIADGVIGREFDVAPAIVQAVEDVARLRQSGVSLAEHLAQGDMLSTVSLATRAFYDKAGDRLLGREQAAAALTRYADAAMAQRLNQGQLFADPLATPAELLEAAAAKPATTDMFGLRTRQGETKPGAGETAAPERETIAAQVLADKPNLEIATEREMERAKSLVMANEQLEASTQQDAKPAVDAAVDCFSRRAA